MTSSKLLEIRSKARRLHSSGSFEAALRLWDAIVASAPHSIDARVKVADCLVALNQTRLALAIYRAVGWYAIKAGHPLSAIVIAKLIESQGGEFDDLLAGLVAYYGKESELLKAGSGARISPPQATTPIADTQPTSPVTKAELIKGAADRALHCTSSFTDYPDALIAIPLLSELSEAAFRRILSTLIVGRLPDRTSVISQGEPGTSFFFIASGTVEVSMTQAGATRVLAQLHENAIFGEMTLLSSRPRNASVVVVGEADLIEFTRDTLAEVAAEIPQVQIALHRFTEQRLLANLMATNPLFRPFTDHQRRDLMRRFTRHEVNVGAEVIRQGDTGRGLFVLLSGELDVVSTTDGEITKLAMLRSGDVFGEMALLDAAATTATVTATALSTVLFLSHQIVARMVEGVPAIREYLTHLSANRQLENQLSQADIDMDIDTTIMI